MKTDCLMELERLYNDVEGKILFADTNLLNLAIAAGDGRVELNGDKPISEREFNYWQPLRKYAWRLLESDLPRRLAYELKANLMEATDKQQVYDIYRAEIDKRKIDGDKAYKEYTERLQEFDLPEATKSRYLSIMGELVGWYSEGITTPLERYLGQIERDYLCEPQPRQAESRPPLMQITDEALDSLKEYFVPIFKGMGNNLNKFDDYLIPALRRCQTKKQVAGVALACYKSDYMNKRRRPGSWNKWAEVVCNLFSIDRLPYKMSELTPPDYDVQYYWLKPENK